MVLNPKIEACVAHVAGICVSTKMPILKGDKCWWVKDEGLFHGSLSKETILAKLGNKTPHIILRKAPQPIDTTTPDGRMREQARAELAAEGFEAKPGKELEMKDALAEFKTGLSDDTDAYETMCEDS